MTIETGDLIIEPEFEEKRKPIHPAIDIVDGHAYIGISIPCLVKKKGREDMMKTQDLPFLVRDDGQKILVNDEVLAKHRLRMVHRPEWLENRWGLEYVNAFTQNPSAPHPIEVLSNVIAEHKRLIEYPDPRDYLYHALWDIGTYFQPIFNAYPYLNLGGIKRVGKTKNLTLHLCLAFNAILSANMSAPSIYRLVQNARATLLVDETEELNNPERRMDFRSLFLSGYKKGGKVYRIEKDKSGRFHTVPFEVFSPKALANIRGLEDVLEDRCKISILKRSRNRVITDREIELNDERWPRLRDSLYRLYLKYWPEVAEKYRSLGEVSEVSEICVYGLREVYPRPQGDFDYLTSRELELWKPVFALAMFFDDHLKNTSSPGYSQTTLITQISPTLTPFTSSKSPLTAIMVDQALDYSKERSVEDITETGEGILATVLLEIVGEDGYYSTKQITTKMEEFFDEDQKWLNAKWVGRALRRLGFKEKRRVGTGVEWKLKRQDVEDLAGRLQLDLGKGIVTDEIKTRVLETLKSGALDDLELQKELADIELPTLELALDELFTTDKIVKIPGADGVMRWGINPKEAKKDA